MKLRSMKIVLGTVLVSLLAPAVMAQAPAPPPTPSKCYTTNCTGGDITNRRKCYLCCATWCMGTNNEIPCQNDCDAKWMMMIGEYLPMPFYNRLMGAKYNAQAQRELLTDAEVWDWLVIDGTVSWQVLEVADWLLDNAVNENLERLALVNLTWLAGEHQIDLRGREVVELALKASLRSPNPAVRRGAIIGLREAGFPLEDPNLLRELINIICNDPDPSVRSIGLEIVAKAREDRQSR